MNFKRRIDWRKWLGVAGWVALGYFMGRPDQLERLARNLNNQMATQRFIIPATVTTIHQPVLIQRQPIIVAAPQPISQIQTQGWSQLSDPQARFSVLVPGVVKKKGNSQKQTFSVTTTNEFYAINYESNFPNSELITDKGHQLILENVARTLNSQEFRVVGKRSFGLNGVPGVEIHLQHRDVNVPPTVMRQMVVNDRFYSLWATTPYPQNAQTFLNSFRLH
ncbi:hypothetical protein QUB29_26425 [Microcoleus sp. B4b_D2]|uniref:hypothetical protein n=1 Tax=Microcoleus sp. B4b_D2 TaxID=3055310 RepID=UPI002FD6201C